jgi:hypothetical protein
MTGFPTNDLAGGHGELGGSPESSKRGHFLKRIRNRRMELRLSTQEVITLKGNTPFRNVLLTKILHHFYLRLLGRAMTRTIVGIITDWIIIST